MKPQEPDRPEREAFLARLRALGLEALPPEDVAAALPMAARLAGQARRVREKAGEDA